MNVHTKWKELFDTHFVWFGQVLVISGLKMLVLYNRYKKADAIVSYSNVHVAESCVCIVTWDCKGHTVEYTFCNSSCNFPPMLRIRQYNYAIGHQIEKIHDCSLHVTCIKLSHPQTGLRPTVVGKYPGHNFTKGPNHISVEGLRQKHP